MKIHCPHCGVNGSADDAYIGRKIRCPKCDMVFRCQEDRSPTGFDSDMSPDIRIAAEVSVPVELSEIVQDTAEATQDVQPDEALSLSQEEVILSPERQSDLFPEPTEGKSEDISEEERPVAAAEVEAFGDVDAIDKDADISAEIVSPGSIPAATGEEAAVSAEIVGFVEREERNEIEPESDAELELEKGPGSETAPSEVPPPVDDTFFAKPQDASASAGGGGAKQRRTAVTVSPYGTQPRSDFMIGEALTEAWQRTKGAKGTVWGAMGVMYLVMLVLGFGLVFLQTSSGLSPESIGGIWLGIGINALSSAVSTIFTAGLMYIGVCLAAGKSCSWKTIIEGFPAAVQLLIASILMSLLVISGVILLVLPGVYLAIGYTLTLPLMLDRRLGPWEAMEKSRKAIHKVWWKVFGLFLIMGLITAVSAIPLGIGLIWTVPMNIVLCGVVYRYLFGVQGNKS